MENKEFEKPNYYSIIPAEIRYDKNLKDKAKLLYGEITSLSNKNGYCYASNDYFSNLYGVTKVTISNLISDLVEKGYIERVIIYKEGSKEILNRYLKISKYPIKENFNRGIKENFKDNNTSNNITSNNNSSSNNNIIFNLSTEAVDFYNNNIGLLTPYQYELLSTYTQDGMEDKLVIYAMKKACEVDKRNFAYIKAILNAWNNKGIKTLIEAQNETENFKNNKKQKKETIEERAKRLEKMLEEEK